MRFFLLFFYCLFFIHSAIASEKSEPLCFNSHLQGKNIKYFTTSYPLNKYSEKTFPYGFFKKNITTDILILKQENNESSWLLFETPTHPTHEREKFHLLIDNPILDSVSLYEFKNDSFILKKTFTLHDSYPSNQSITNYIEFEVKLGKRYLLKVNKTPYSFLPIYFLDNEQYIDTIQKSSLRDGIYFGFILIMCLFIGIFYIKTKETINLIYTLYLAGIFLVNLTLQGYAFKHIYPNYPEINNHINGLMSFALVFTPIFVYYFLDIHKNQPKFKILYILTTLLYLVCGILSFITNDNVALAILQLIAILQTILFIYNAIIAYKMNQENVIFFFIGWGIYLSSALYIILATSNVINPEPWALRSIAYGSIFEIIFFSAAIAKRFSNYKKENEEIQLKLIEFLKEKEKILNEQKTLLEIEVRKRTLELEESNQSLNDFNVVIISDFLLI